MENANYIFVLDIDDNKVYKYDIRGKDLGNTYQKSWENCEAFLTGAGHSLSSIRWMITSNDTIVNGNTVEV